MASELKKEVLRYNEIDLIEAIAIFFVIFYHCTTYSFDFISNGTFHNYFLYFTRTILATCVPIFFFVNGFLLLNKPFNLKKHITKCVNLLVIIFFWAIITMPIYLMIKGEPITLNAIVVPILNLSTDYDINLFWFLGALICIYILFPLLKSCFDTNKKAFIFFTVVCGILTLGFNLINEIVLIASRFTGTLESGIEVPLLTMFNLFRGSYGGMYGYSFVYFCTGGLFYSFKDKILNIPSYKRNLISISGIIVCCSCLFIMGVLHSKYVHNKTWDIVWNGYDTIFTFFNVIFIYTLCLNYKKEFKLIKTISINTMGIYLIHNIFINLCTPHITDSMKNIGFNTAFALIVLLLSLLLSVILKKIPIIKNFV